MTSNKAVQQQKMESSY